MEHHSKLLLNESEAALVLSISRHFLRRDRISTNSVGIPFVRIGSAVRYRLSDLKRWIESRSQSQHALQLPQPAVLAQVHGKRGRGRPRKEARVLTQLRD